MKFRCRKCTYYGNSHTCPNCGWSCKLMFSNEEEREAMSYFHHAFLDDVYTKNWSPEFDSYIRIMERMGMVKIKHEVAEKVIQHPIWTELAFLSMSHKL